MLAIKEYVPNKYRCNSNERIPFKFVFGEILSFKLKTKHSVPTHDFVFIQPFLFLSLKQLHFTIF